MENKDKPSFPVIIDKSNSVHTETHVGLTKREYFAAMALKGLLTTLIPLDNNQLCPNDEGIKLAVKLAVIAADELGKELTQYTGA